MKRVNILENNYAYPLMPEWSKDEIIKMVEFYAAVEQANTTGIDRENFLKKVAEYRKIEPSIAAQKQLDREFKTVSGLSIYQTIKTANETTKKWLKVRK